MDLCSGHGTFVHFLAGFSSEIWCLEKETALFKHENYRQNKLKLFGGDINHYMTYLKKYHPQQKFDVVVLNWATCFVEDLDTFFADLKGLLSSKAFIFIKENFDN